MALACDAPIVQLNGAYLEAQQATAKWFEECTIVLAALASKAVEEVLQKDSSGIYDAFSCALHKNRNSGGLIVWSCG